MRSVIKVKIYARRTKMQLLKQALGNIDWRGTSC